MFSLKLYKYLLFSDSGFLSVFLPANFSLKSLMLLDANHPFLESFSGWNWLIVLLLVNILTIVCLSFTENIRFTKYLSLWSSFIQLFISLVILIVFDCNLSGTQFNFIGGSFSLPLIEGLTNMVLLYHLGIDGLSLFLVLLSVFLLPVCIIASWNTVTYRVRDFHLLLHIITLLLINVFCVQDLLLFYIFFESILIPMFFVIGIWGSRDRKIHAGYQFFLYTVVGSLMMLLGIIYLLVTVGSTHCVVLYMHEYSILEGRLIWLAFFLSFAVKVPMVPFHIWLPEAHVEAPTAGSVLLAGILLKMGTYGLIKFSLPMFPEATVYFKPLVFVMSLVGIVYAACTTIRQVDLKKVIAYSSVGHMNYVTLGILSNNIYGLEGSVLLMLGHGLVSSALFLCVGLLYERYSSRVILYYGGLIFGMPVFGLLFLFFTFANVSLPGTSNFIGEFLILIGVSETNIFVLLVACVGVILGAVYAIWLYNRVMFGLVKDGLRVFSDLNSKEVALNLILVVLILLFGFYPSYITDTLHLYVMDVLDRQL
jgi:proton-translocating NADH-quinone oxidoreductase chain M